MSDTEGNAYSDSLLNVIKERYGDRLTDDQLEEVKKGVEGMAKVTEALRKVEIQNGDEPFSVFVPYRGES